MLDNIHNCGGDDLFGQIMDCSMKIKGENYTMFLLAKHGNTELISKVIRMREKSQKNRTNKTNKTNKDKHESELIMQRKRVFQQRKLK